MPSYTQYLRQMAALDADDSDIESWITVKGNHIPIKKGQSKEDAVKSFIAKKKGELVGNHNSLIEAMKLEEQGYFGEKTPSHRAAITKSANEMGKEEKNLEYLMEFGVKEANSAQKENGRKERPVHISEALNDVMTETKEKMERGHGKPEHYAHKWETALEPHNLTDKELEDKLSLYRSVRRNRPDDNELIDKINDIKHVLELRQKKD